MRKKVSKLFLVGTAILISSCIINFIPTMNLKSKEMNELAGKWIHVYYEKEESAAKDVFEYADSGTALIATKLGFESRPNVNVYIYDTQKKMQTKKYGYVALILDLDWYIGDNIGTDVILTSPANPGNVHDYNNNKYAVLHEIVHAYVSVLNEDIALWLTEGVALYLSNGEPFQKEYLETMGVPTYKEICSNNPITFSDCGGYTFAHIYIEYLEKTYGWDKVMQLIKTEDYQASFGKSQKEIYDEWAEYIMNYPDNNQ